MSRGLVRGSKKAKDAGRKAAITRARNQAKAAGIEVKDIAVKEYDGKGKSEFRKKLVDTMYQNGVAWGTIVSLETSQWRFNKSIPGNHIHYQCDPYEYKQMKKTKPDDTKLIFGDIKTLVELKTPIDGLWLDYMRTYDKLEADIEKIIDSRAMRHCSVIGLTISPRSPGKNKERQLQADRIITSMDNIFEDYVRCPIFPYRDGAPMWGIIFVNKNNRDLGHDAEKIYDRILGDIFCYDIDAISYIGGGEVKIERKGCTPTIIEAWKINKHYSRESFKLDNRIPDRGYVWGKHHRSSFFNEELQKEFVDNRNLVEHYENTNLLNAFDETPRDFRDIREKCGISRNRFNTFIRIYNNILVEQVDKDKHVLADYRKYIRKKNVDLLECIGWGFFNALPQKIEDYRNNPNHGYECDCKYCSYARWVEQIHEKNKTVTYT
jgi:hypothetical protein